MKKLFTLTLAVALAVVLAMPAAATESRQAALAGAGNYIEDDYNIFTWYGTLPSYTNIVWMNINYEEVAGVDTLGDMALTTDTSWEPVTMLGASYGLGEDNKYGTLAMFFFKNTMGLNPFGSDWGDKETWYGAGTFNERVNNKFCLMYGYGAESFSFGLFFSRADQGEVVKGDLSPNEEEIHAAYTTIGAGVRFDIGESAYGDLALDINFASYAFDNKSIYPDPGIPPDTLYPGEITEDGNMMIGFRGRMFYECNDVVSLVPYFSYRSFDFSTQAEIDSLYSNYGDKAMMLDFGIGANIAVNEDNLLIFAIEPFSYMKRQPSKDIEGESKELKTMVMPRFILALESDVKDWLTFRVGGCKELIKDKFEESEKVGTTTKESTTTRTYSNFNYFMGLGFHVGDFDIDCVINNSLPRQMGYWLTGYEYDGDCGPPVYSISAKYHF